MLEQKSRPLPKPVPEANIRELITVAGRLVALMRRETASVRAVSGESLAGLVSEKAALVEAFSTLTRAFHRDPETVAAVTDALRGELEDTFVEFEATARENERTLAAAREANESVLRAVVSAAEAQRPRAQGYGRTGTAPTPLKPTDRRLGPVAIDRRL